MNISVNKYNSILLLDSRNTQREYIDNSRYVKKQISANRALKFSDLSFIVLFCQECAPAVAFSFCKDVVYSCFFSKKQYVHSTRGCLCMRCSTRGCKTTPYAYHHCSFTALVSYVPYRII